MRLTRVLRAVGGVLEIMLLLLVLAGGALALRLAAGPISLAPLQPYIERLIERAGPFEVSFRNPALAWSQLQSSVLLRVEDLQVKRPTGELVGAAPAVGLRVDLAALIKHQEVRLREVDVTLPALQLTRRADRHLVLSFGGHIADLPLGEATGGGLLKRLAGGADEAGDQRFAGLRRIRVTAASLQFVDQASGRVIDSGGVRLRLTRERSGWEARLDVVTLAGIPGSRLRAVALPLDSSAEQQVTVTLEDLPLQALDGLLPEVRLAGTAIPLAAEVQLTVDPATLTPGPGAFRATAGAGTLTMPEILARALGVRQATIAGKADAGWGTVTLEQAEAAVGGTVLRATGTARRSPDLWSLSLDLTAEGLDARSLLGLWPLPLASGARRWVEEHVTAGRVPKAELELRHAPGQPVRSIDYRLGFELAEAATTFLPDWPAATGLAGTGRLDRERLALDLTGGRIGDAVASRCSITFTELRSPQPTRMALTLAAEGSVRTALDLLSRKPLQLTQKLEIAPEAASGRAEAEISFALPLRKEVPATEVTRSVKASLSELSVRAIRKGYDVTAGELQVEVDDEKATIRGEAALNTVPVRVDWLERLEDDGERRRVAFTGELNGARARALHLPWPPETSGQVPVSGVVIEGRRGPRRIEAEGDLAQLAVGLPAYGLVKRPGAAGRLQARLEQPDERSLKLVEAEASWDGVRLRAGADIALEPADWRQIELASVVTPVAALTGSLAKQDGVIRATVAADRLDLRPYRGRQQGEEAPGPDIDLDLRAARLHLADEPLEAVALRAQRRRGDVVVASASTRLPGGGETTFSLDAARLPGQFAGETSDLGALLRGLGLEQSRVERGRGRVEGRVESRAGHRAWVGEAKLRELVVRDTPLLVRILTLGSLTGLANTVGGGGLAIERITIPFVWDEGRIELRQTRLVGSGLGARIDGTVDLNQRKLDLQGTLAPLYAINRLIGQIPLLGNLLRGDKADAAIAATFSVGGTFDDPQVSVNPLAALVPGFLRDLLGDLFDGAEAPAPPERG